MLRRDIHDFQRQIELAACRQRFLCIEKRCGEGQTENVDGLSAD